MSETRLRSFSSAAAIGAGAPSGVVDSPTSARSSPTAGNIETIIRLEEEAEHARSLAERLSELIGHFVGTIPFITCQILVVSLWVFFNQADASTAFDPFPFPLLGGLLAFECVLLTAFVLIRQNRMSLRADRRNHLALQINLLSEKEITKVIQMLERMSRQMGIEGAVTDPQSKQLAQDTSIESIARDLQDNLAESSAPKTES